MVQLLIVDDEKHVVDRFCHTIDWGAVGIEQVHKAYSGQEALSLLSQTSIDIVMTDIRMPGMSGLQLISEIRQKWQKTKCILLSGHSEFMYAQEAISYQTEEYLLKPIKDEELLRVIGRVKDKLHAEWEQVVSKQRLTYTIKENMPLLRSALLGDLLQGRPVPESTLHEKMNSLGLNNGRGQSFALMMIRLEELQNDDMRSNSLREYAVTNIVEELFEDRYDCWHTKDAHDYLVFVMRPKESDFTDKDVAAWFQRTASVLQSAVKTYLKSNTSILISGQGQFPEDLRALYDQSVSSFRTSIGNAHEFFVSNLGEKIRTASIVKSLYSLYEPPTLIHLLEASGWASVEGKLGTVFDEMEREGADSPEQLLEVYFSIASSYSYIAHKNGKSLSCLMGQDYERMAKGRPFRSVQDLKDWAFRGLERIRKDMDQEMKYSRSSLIKEIRNFIEKNMFQDISLNIIAEHVFLHPVYVSTIYKLETDENLSDYLLRVRMEKAEYMLKNTSDKIFEIAARIGYQRPHSFNFAFKKKFGMTPQNYRDQFC